MAKKKIKVQGLEIRIEPINDKDYVSLTDIAKYTNKKRPEVIIQRWLQNNSTIRYLFLWEQIHNEKINHTDLSVVLEEATNHSKYMSPKRWIELINSIGMISRTGRNGGTYAHKDIAISFLYWLNPEFQIYFIKEFQRLKEMEYNQKSLEWHISRITDNVEELRNLLDTIPHQKSERDRTKKLGK